MPHMSNLGRAISMTRSDSWTSTLITESSDVLVNYCINKCPHPDSPCKGECSEFLEFRKSCRRKQKKK